MSEQAPQSHNTSTTPVTSKEKRHSVLFKTAVVGARHPIESGTTYRKGEIYGPGQTLPMTRFLAQTEAGTSLGMLVVTKDTAGKTRRFFVVRGGPKGVLALPSQVSITNVDRAVAEKSFDTATNVVNPETIAPSTIVVGRELIPGTGPVERVILDTGERSPIGDIDTNSEGYPLYNEQLGKAIDELKIVERSADTSSPFRPW